MSVQSTSAGRQRCPNIKLPHSCFLAELLLLMIATQYCNANPCFSTASVRFWISIQGALCAFKHRARQCPRRMHPLCVQTCCYEQNNLSKPASRSFHNTSCCADRELDISVCRCRTWKITASRVNTSEDESVDHRKLHPPVSPHGSPIFALQNEFTVYLPNASPQSP